MWGEFLINAQGEDVVAGVRTPKPIGEMAEWNLALYGELDSIVSELENRRNDVVDVEFTVEQGKLFILQVRTAKRTPEAAATIATHFVWEKRWSKAEALARVSDEQLDALSSGGFKPEALADAATSLIAEGLPASPGAAVGRPVFTSEEAVRAAKAGESVVVLARPDTSPDDLPGMLAAVAIVTETGGTRPAMLQWWHAAWASLLWLAATLTSRRSWVGSSPALRRAATRSAGMLQQGHLGRWAHGLRLRGRD